MRHRVSQRPVNRSEQPVRYSAALGVSVALHLTALAALALLGGGRRASTADLSFETAWDLNDAPRVELVATEKSKIESKVSAQAPDQDLVPAGAVAHALEPRAPIESSMQPAETMLSARDLAMHVNWGAKGQGATGVGLGSGQGGGGFFGLNAIGQKVVYVVDCSRSMNHPYPGPAATRMVRVKLELLRSVVSLRNDQQFFIVFFNHNAFPMPSDHLVEATDEAKKKYLEWMAKAEADGFTDPAAALLLALRLKPDVIYFLTDGDFRAGIVREIAVSNHGAVAIHTIGFGDNRGEPLLKLIAKQNNGVYHFIAGEEDENPAE